MSAYQDKDQVVKFYFGNAMKDLAAVLPKEDAHRVPSVVSSEYASIEHTLTSVENTLSQVLGAQRELSFLVHDISRMTKKL